MLLKESSSWLGGVMQPGKDYLSTTACPKVSNSTYPMITISDLLMNSTYFLPTHCCLQDKLVL